MGEIALRPYQKKFISDIRKLFIAKHKRVVGVAPCGAGKTIMTGWMIRETFQRNKSAIFFVHRRELIEQTSQTFYQLHIPHGIIAGGFKPHYEFPVQIASVQTLVNRMSMLNPPDLLVCDECHHILADTYKEIINAWNNSYLLGVTATPERTGGITLADTFDDMVLAPSVSDLIQLGNLTHFNYFKIDLQIDSVLNNVKVKRGDYEIKGLSKLMIDPVITRAIVDSYIDNANDKSAICYCVNVEHSQFVAQYFNDAGISAAHCDGTTPKADRELIVEDFRRGKYKILCNAELFGEGFDVPNCHAVILARPTKSLTLHIQQSMRSMRPDPNVPDKVAIIIDCVKNFKRHGYPDDPRNWSLDPKVKNKGEQPFRQCPFCGSQIPLSSEFCPVCGKKLFFDGEYIINADDAKLIYSSNESNHISHNFTDIIHAPDFLAKFDKFVSIGERRNYNSPKRWAAYQMLDHIKSFDELVALRKLSGMQYGWEFHQAKDLHIPIPDKKGLQKNPSACTI